MAAVGRDVLKAKNVTNLEDIRFEGNTTVILIKLIVYLDEAVIK